MAPDGRDTRRRVAEGWLSGTGGVPALRRRSTAPASAATARISGGGRRRLLGVLLVGGAAALSLPAAAAAQPAQAVTDEDVELAIQRAVEHLWATQGEDGQWHDKRYDRLYIGGLTSLAAFTLRTAGVGVGDPRLRKSVNFLIEHEAWILSNYARSFRLMLWTVLEPHKYRKQIRADVRLLASRQSRDGVWGYGGLGAVGVPSGWGDNSNSQLALLALWESTQYGGEVSRMVWNRAEDAWLDCQNSDGGWGYAPVDNVNRLRPESYGSMTAAGLATMYILGDQLYARSGGVFDGRRIKQCGAWRSAASDLRRAIDRAWDWMDSRFVADSNPDFPRSSKVNPSAWLTYYLYSVERAGVASGYKTFGPNNWYRDLAEQLVRTQQPDGGWGRTHQTCFALLALVKGRTPIALNKLRYGSTDDWNNNPRDAANLTRWLSRKLETPLTWQIVTLDSPEADVKDAPILYITGHVPPELSELEREVLRDYVLSGGTVVAVACCSQERFASGIGGLFEEVFPGFKREVLPRDHALWRVRYPLEPTDDVVGYSDGCRTRLFIVTRGVCGAWQQNLHAKYEEMFRLGANLLAYATNRTMPRSVAWGPGAGRITGLGRGAHAQDLAEARRGRAISDRTLSIGRLNPGRGVQSDPYALSRLADEMTRNFGLDVRESPGVDLSGGDLSGYDILWLAGHDLVLPEGLRLEALKKYLAAGGTLVVSPCCGTATTAGRASPGDAIVSWLEDAFGVRALVDIGSDDPLVTGHLAPGASTGPTEATDWLGSDLRRVRLKRQAGGSSSTLAAPTTQPNDSGDATGQASRVVQVALQGVRFPAKNNDSGRWAVIYSPIDIHCGCDGHFCPRCNGYEPRDARAVAGNLLLYVHLRQAGR